ncbi:MAG: hypothetical protein EOP87_08670 [Verrucomicrobiaceae bacterium]|nr:MAG: hypothetical protein EOP87_08670 [Verrucomicrobiaceae bacterium]
MRLAASLVLACGVHGTTLADEVRLEGEARLSGRVRSIDSSGAVGLESPLAPEVLLLNPGAVSKIEFAVDGVEPPRSTALIELANGDLLPASVESMDENNLTVTALDSGRLVIPRAALRSLQLGVRGRKVIYSGPGSLAEWAPGGDAGRNWTFVNKGLAANGPARASLGIDTPRQFIFKCSLKWKGNPSFQISFADPLKTGSDPVDRYYFQFNAGGFEIKREASTGKRYHTVIPSSRTPDQFSSGTLDVEIRVDRTSSRLDLFLNGEPEGSGIDPVATAPDAGGISIVNMAPSGTQQEIRGIEISEYDNARARHRAEERGDTSVDSLISREDDRWGGRLTSIRAGEGGTVFTFRSDFQQEPLELAEKDVSTLFFASEKNAGPPAAEGPFILRLSGEGSLRVASCSFASDAISITHPLLGEMNIKRASVSALERPKGKTQAPDGK